MPGDLGLWNLQPNSSSLDLLTLPLLAQALYRCVQLGVSNRDQRISSGSAKDHEPA